MEGKKECPECRTISLIEDGLTSWKCLYCGRVFNEEGLGEDFKEQAEENYNRFLDFNKKFENACRKISITKEQGYKFFEELSSRQ